LIAILRHSATVLALAAICPTVANAQAVGVGGFFDIGTIKFTASQSFEAVLGASAGSVFGGGGQIVLPGGVFASVRASRFTNTGERVFVFEGETFDLGIDTTVKIRPVEVTAGYRFRGGPRNKVIPYIGGGIGWHRYEETSDFAEDAENVDETFRGYHLLGGAEYRLRPWFGIGGEFQWTTVPDALGQDPNGASAAFGETDLGGIAFRARFVVGM
jgi:opacity protein-like surface antigen